VTRPEISQSPEQVVKVIMKEVTDSSAKKRASLIGSASAKRRNTGTKTPAAYLTDNTFNAARKSAAPYIGLRKTSATPSAQRQLGMNFNMAVGSQTTQSR
jgi:hypothetical protein